MREDVTSCRLTTIDPCKESTGSWIRHDLIGLAAVSLQIKNYKDETRHQDTKVEFFSHLSGSSEELTEGGLTFGEFTTAHIIGTEQSHDAVDDKESVFVGSKIRA